MEQPRTPRLPDRSPELDPLRGGEQTAFGSAMARAATKAVDHLAARGASPSSGGETSDPIELWGKRIGRGLSVIAFLALAAYLAHTLLR